MNLSGILSSSLAAAMNIVSDVEAAVAKGGGPLAEVIAVSEALWSDAAFKANVEALIAAIKASS